MSDRKAAAILFLIFAIVLILRLSFVNEPFERDEGAYGAIAQVILDGGVPYRDTVDHKPPGIYYIYAAMISIAGNSTASIRAITALYTLLTVFSVYCLSRYIAGVNAGLVSAFLYGVFSSGPIIRGSSSNCEVFMVLPLMLGTYLLLVALESGCKLRLASSGLLLGMAMLIKPTALPFLLLLISVLIFWQWEKSEWREICFRMSCFVGPVLLMAVITLAYFYWRGALRDFIFWNLKFNSMYGKTSFQDFVFILVKKGLPTLVEFLPILVVGTVTMVWLFLRKLDSRTVLLAGMAIASVVAVCMPGKFSPYYFILMIAPFSMLSGIGLTEAWKHKKWPLYLTGSLFAGTLLVTLKVDYPFYVTYTPEQISKAIYGTDAFVSAVKIADHIRSRTTSKDTIFQWGWEPEIYFLSDRRSPNRFIAPLFIEAEVDKNAAVKEMIGSLRDSKPKYIVLNKGWEMISGFEEFSKILVYGYTLDLMINDFMVFRIKEV